MGGEREAHVDHNPRFPVCLGCGDRIGVYEPLWVELADGGLRSSSYLNLGSDEARERSRLWHLRCLTPDQANSAPET